MPETPTLRAARDLLGTLSGARAALNALAAQHLPPGRVMALAREADTRFDDLNEAEAVLHRRLELWRRVVQAGIPSAVAEATAERGKPNAFVIDGPTKPPKTKAPRAPVVEPAEVAPVEENPLELGSETDEVPRSPTEAESGRVEIPADVRVDAPADDLPPIDAAAREEVTDPGLGGAGFAGTDDAPTYDPVEPEAAWAQEAAPAGEVQLSDSLGEEPPAEEEAEVGPASVEDEPAAAVLDESAFVVEAPPEPEPIAEVYAVEESAVSTEVPPVDLAPVDLAPVDVAPEPSPEPAPLEAPPLAEFAELAAALAGDLEDAPPAAVEPADEAPVEPERPRPTPAAPQVRAVGPVHEEDEEEDDAPSGPSAPARAGAATLDLRGARPVGPRIAAPEEDEDAEPDEAAVAAGGEDTDEDDELESGSGVAVKGGLKLSFDRAKKAAPAAPRLTDDDRGTPTNITMTPEPFPAQKVVIEDGVVAGIMNESHALARRGDFHKAIQSFTDALDMKPSFVDGFIGRGRCYLEIGDYSSAMSDFQRAEDLQPDKPDPHVAMGDLYFARKEYKRAIEFYDQAVELDGSHAMARCRRGISHYYRKSYRQAFQDLQRALVLDPEIPNIRKYVQMAQKKLERGE